MVTGYPAIEAESRSAEEGKEAALDLTFPYVLWAPGIRAHYLWRVFSRAGFELLSKLGSRVQVFSIKLEGLAQGV